jgi:hypothetical protein
MFGKKKGKTPPRPRSAPESSGTRKKPTLNDDQTETLRILLGDTDLSIEQDADSGCDPHDNSGQHSVTDLRRKL